MRASSYCRRPHGENMQGTDTSVLVPQLLALVKASTSGMAASWGVVWRA
jgi:hypothetical protein